MRANRRPHALLAAALISVSGLVVGVISWQWQARSPVKVAIGIDLPLVPGAAIDPSDRHTADLYLEDHPGSRMRLVNHINDPDPATGPASIVALKREGVRFFITTQASNQAVPSLTEFADGQALAINVSATSNQLSGHDDYFFRVVPDAPQEQRAIARQLNSLPGKRLLVIQDTGNRAYTDPAFETFSRELERSDHWQVVHHELLLSQFNFKQDRSLLMGPYDALYILGGGFLPVIGNIAQLFHSLNPNAPILLTPWARSPAILESAGPAASQILITSPFPARKPDGVIDRYLQRFERRFGYTPYAMGLSTRQALELLDRALASGASTPAAVKRYLLSKREHPTSFGPVRFDATGDVDARYHFFQPSAKARP